MSGPKPQRIHDEDGRCDLQQCLVSPRLVREFVKSGTVKGTGATPPSILRERAKLFKLDRAQSHQSARGKRCSAAEPLIKSQCVIFGVVGAHRVITANKVAEYCGCVSTPSSPGSVLLLHRSSLILFCLSALG